MRYLRIEIAHGQAIVSRRREFGLSTRHDEAPLAERRNIRVIRVSLVARVAQRRLDGPIRMRCKVRRGRLHHHESVRCDPLLEECIERHRVELSQGKRRRIRKVHEGRVEALITRLDPARRIRIDQAQPRIVKRIMVEGDQNWRSRKQARHLRVQVDERHFLDIWIAQYFAQCQPIAAAQDQNRAGPWQRFHRGMHERFVIAMFIARRKLQIAVDVQA